MKLLYPKTTGCLCANSHPGSYTGQDAYNDMLIVLMEETSGIIPGGGHLGHAGRVLLEGHRIPEWEGA